MTATGPVCDGCLPIKELSLSAKGTWFFSVRTTSGTQVSCLKFKCSGTHHISPIGPLSIVVL